MDLQLLSCTGQLAGPCYLYFGCRSRSKDYYYQEQLERMVQDGILAEERGLQVAFSRDQEKKVYVQHLLAENSKKLWTLINEACSLLRIMRC